MWLHGDHLQAHPVLGPPAVLHGLPEPGRTHVVLAWQRGAEGRKHHSGTALLDPDGRLLARAEATWIAVDPTAVRPRERS